MKSPAIAILFCSPRRSGNTGMLLELLVDAFSKEGLETETKYLYELNFSGCTECEMCYNGDDCVIADDMKDIYPILENACGILFLTPVFFASLPSQAKAVIDRAQPYYIRKYVFKKSPRKPGLGGLIAHSERKGSFDCLTIPVKYFFDSLGLDFVPPLFLPSLRSVGESENSLIRAFVENFSKRLKELH